MESHTEYELEELDVLWFFGLGYYYKQTFWSDGVLLENQLQHRLYQPISKDVAEAAIEKKRHALSSPERHWSWFCELDDVTKPRFLKHLDEQRLLADRYEPILRRIVANIKPHS